jgi:hypothetical protein
MGALGIAATMLVTSFAVGLALKVAADQRRRVRLIQYIQDSESQTPFVSAEVKAGLGLGRR